MIPRVLEALAIQRARQYPVVTVTGPRQSGKTTLCRAAFPDKPYVSLETPDVREEALRDPRGFLARYPAGAVLDEVQRAPALLSYLQEIVDERRRNGDWVLSGSQNFALLERVTQSLAGRSAMLQLLPLSFEEVRTLGRPRSLDEQLLRGGYPRLYDQDLAPQVWLADYVMSYIERDVRQLQDIGDLGAFQTFLRVCAGRVGQVLNLSALGADCGISHTTARRWMSVLEASYVAFPLRPLHRNVTKRLTKSPKLHFYDVGLAAYLLGIRTREDLAYHPLRGALFENWVVSEVLKWRWNRGLSGELAYYRDARGAEIDLVLDRPFEPIALEVKAGRTPLFDLGAAFESLASTLQAPPIPARSLTRRVAYGGERELEVDGVRFLPWDSVDRADWS
jgi:predicted AAA+ superfamily ATPase